MPFFSVQQLTIGYNGHPLISDISFGLERGEILTLIGPNGAGKSTLLKTVTRQLPAISGHIFIGEKDMMSLSGKNLAKIMAVVLTERIRPELMTCAEVVAMGRYPYTDMFGRLSEQDRTAVRDALDRVHALDLADQDFSTLSDGQRQRILLARAICQEPEVLILDEPTAYLDIRYKIELLEILRDLARSKGTVIIMSLHEVDLAMKISDSLICLDGSGIAAEGAPEEIMTPSLIENLYDIREGTYDLLFGSVELPKPQGEPRVFVLSGCGLGTPCYRLLQKKGIPFAAGILFENDTDCRPADALGARVFKTAPFRAVPDSLIEEAAEVMRHCEFVLDPGKAAGSLHTENRRLLEIAREEGLPVRTDLPTGERAS